MRSDLPRFVGWLERGALALGVLQFPFVISQFLFSSRLSGRFNADAIVGTFGGDPYGSGQNPTLLLFSIVAILVAIEMRQTARLGRIAFGAICTVCAANIMLGEVKAAFVLLPLGLVIQQRLGVRINWFKAGAGLIFVAVFLVLLGQAYEALFWSEASSGNSAFLDKVQESIGYFFDPNSLNFVTGEVSRGASLVVWWNHDIDVVHRLFGYGMGSTRLDSAVANGVIGLLFAPLDVASTALSQLLWDGGVVGTFFYIATMIAAYLQAAKLARRATTEVGALQMRTVTAIIALFFPFLIYNRDMLVSPAEQLLIVTLFALVWARSGQALAVGRPNGHAVTRWHPQHSVNRPLVRAGYMER